MSLARVHTWVAGEVLLASDLNSEFNNILNNPGTLISGAVLGLGQSAFNYYGEGSWTPTDQSGAGLSLTVNSAKYTRFGRQVIAVASITYPVTADGSAVKIGGLPFTVNNDQANRGACAMHDDSSGVVYGPEPDLNAATFQVWNVITAAKVINSAVTGRTLFLSIVYFV